MRDIRQDLKERLSLAEASRGDAENAIALAQKQLDDALHSIRLCTALLELESARAGGDISQQAILPQVSVVDFIMGLIKSAPVSKEHLKAMAIEEGYFRDDDSPGRVIHATLMNLVRAGRISMLPDGAYVEVQPSLDEGVVLEAPSQSITQPTARSAMDDVWRRVVSR